MRLSNHSAKKWVSLILYFSIFFILMGLFFLSWSPTSSMPTTVVSIEDATDTELAPSLIFTVTRDIDTEAITTTVYISSNTAISGDDFLVSSPQIITFAAGSGITSKAFTVSILEDPIVEPDETFTVTLNSEIGGSIFVTHAIGTILNFESAEIEFFALQTPEESSGTTPYTVTLSAPVSEPITVTVSTDPITATSEISNATPITDFVSLNNFEIIIPPLATTATGSITILDDNLVEMNENFEVGLTGFSSNLTSTVFFPEGSVITLGTTISEGVLILNDDFATVSISSVGQAEGDSGTSTMVFTATLDNPVDRGFSVSYSTSDGTATAGEDYVGASDTITFASGSTESQPIAITINGDSDIETNETFNLSLDSLLNTIFLGSISLPSSPVTGTIQNDDSIQLLLEAGSSSEVSGTIPFTVSLVSASLNDITVTVSTTDTTATLADSDYVPITSFQIPILAGQTTPLTNQFVTINNDNKVEADETFSIFIESYLDGSDVITSNLPAPAAATILNDDVTHVSIMGPISILEGDSGVATLVVSATIDNPIAEGFSVSYVITPGTATAGTDFGNSTGTFNFAGTAGEVDSIEIDIIGDTIVEPNETFSITLDAVSGTTLTDSVSVDTTSSVATIIDNDTAGVSINSQIFTEDDSGTKEVVFAVQLTRDVAQGFTVDYASQDNTATAISGDYAAVSGTLAFAGIEAETQSITVTINGDTIVEADETFTITLSNISNSGVALLQEHGTGTIENDDSATIQITSPLTIFEGNAGQQNIPVSVTVDAPIQGGFELPWSVTENGASVSDGDFAAGTSPVSFNGTAGETQAIVIEVFGDFKVELDEGVTINLGTPTLPIGIASADVQVTNGQSALTIANEDQAAVSIQGFSRVEGTGDTPSIFTVFATLSAPVDVPISANFSTQDGTASAGIDYSSKSGTLDFSGAANESKPITISVFADAVIESNETFTVEIDSISAGGRAVESGSATITIVDDDDDNGISSFAVFLPLVTRDYTPIFAPDLIVDSIEVGSTTITVTIKNIGNMPVNRPFWVDSYINPSTPPTAVNQTIISLESEGFVWGIDLLESGPNQGLPLDPGEEIVLTVNGLYYRDDESNFTSGVIAPGSTIYAQVDSFGTDARVGQVEEIHELSDGTYNNISQVVGPS